MSYQFDEVPNDESAVIKGIFKNYRKCYPMPKREKKDIILEHYKYFKPYMNKIDKVLSKSRFKFPNTNFYYIIDDSCKNVILYDAGSEVETSRLGNIMIRESIRKGNSSVIEGIQFIDKYSFIDSEVDSGFRTEEELNKLIIKY